MDYSLTSDFCVAFVGFSKPAAPCSRVSPGPQPPRWPTCIQSPGLEAEKPPPFPRRAQQYLSGPKSEHLVTSCSGCSTVPSENPGTRASSCPRLYRAMKRSPKRPINDQEHKCAQMKSASAGLPASGGTTGLPGWLRCTQCASQLPDTA